LFHMGMSNPCGIPDASYPVLFTQRFTLPIAQDFALRNKTAL